MERGVREPMPGDPSAQKAPPRQERPRAGHSEPQRNASLRLSVYVWLDFLKKTCIIYLINLFGHTGS